MAKFWPDLPLRKGYANFGGPAVGCSLRARCPFMAGVWLVETVLFFRPSNTAPQPGPRSRSGDEQKIWEKFTLSLIALASKDRLRYPFVSLFFMMLSCLQVAHLLQENLFDIEFA